MCTKRPRTRQQYRLPINTALSAPINARSLCGHCSFTPENKSNYIMKTTSLSLTALFVAATFFSACNDNTGGSSTPIDSVNQAGKSDVQYSEGTPTTTIDTTIQARDQYSRDTLGMRAGQTA